MVRVLVLRHAEKGLKEGAKDALHHPPRLLAERGRQAPALGGVPHRPLAVELPGGGDAVVGADDQRAELRQGLHFSGVAADLFPHLVVEPLVRLDQLCRLVQRGAVVGQGRVPRGCPQEGEAPDQKVGPVGDGLEVGGVDDVHEGEAVAVEAQPHALGRDRPREGEAGEDQEHVGVREGGGLEPRVPAPDAGHELDQGVGEDPVHNRVAREVRLVAPAQDGGEEEHEGVDPGQHRLCEDPRPVGTHVEDAPDPPLLGGGEGAPPGDVHGAAVVASAPARRPDERPLDAVVGPLKEKADWVLVGVPPRARLEVPPV
mmetsp:Transcript_689/g.1755  ORF Transcript_689/g.1755 Transcript_689/m.1755 type:complete len:315 (-) Transcript_689:809-1753(-)